MKERGKKVPALYETWTTEDKAVGYCWKHKAYVTIRQIREKECMQNGCNAFRKKDHPYWERKERMKDLRKKKKEMGIPVWEKVEMRCDHEGGLSECRRVKN